MTPEQWRRVSELYHAALDRTPEDRASFLAGACSDDAALFQTVQSLLAVPSAAEQFLTGRAAQDAALELAPIGTALIGRQIGAYQIRSLLGAGGMGEVYSAHDTRLGRDVALKILPEAFRSDPDRLLRFEREARLLAQLSHPNIAAIYGIEQVEGLHMLALELVDGETLATRLERGPLNLDTALTYATQIADALAAAHERGVVHRDLKPGNLMVTPTGVKVLDFGVAKRYAHASSHPDPAPALETVTDSVTGASRVIGTVPYMSPEQAEGRDVDVRSDVFSFGVVLYEMLTGHHPFRGDSVAATLASLHEKEPERLRAWRREIPATLERIVLRCLRKQPELRYASARALHGELVAFHAQRARGLHRKVAAAAALIALAAGGVLAAQWWMDASRARWVTTTAIPDLEGLLERNRLRAALKVLREAQLYAPGAPELNNAADTLFVTPMTIRSNPDGAELFIADYSSVEPEDANGTGPHWESLGTSPVTTDTLPSRGYYRVRARKPGFAEAEWAFSPAIGPTFEVPLQRSDTAYDGMVWVPGVRAGLSVSAISTFVLPASSELPAFWIDRHEVTNREFKRFVDAGGYEKTDYWREPFIKQGRELSWAAAMQEFRDKSGRPGPATWETGTYAEGTGELPVGGVSWYEAAAYAVFAAKALPTAYHWYRAANPNFFSDIVLSSNYSGKGVAPAGRNLGITPYGVYDMAGNIKEWVANQTADLRLIMGGAWDEQPYMFAERDARSAFDRLPTFGFRCAKFVTPPAATLLAPIPVTQRSRVDPPVNDETYAIYATYHAYDPRPLDPQVLKVDDSSSYVRREMVSFRAGYGEEERVIVHLYLPKDATPPFQLVTFFPGGNVLVVPSVDALHDPFEFLVRSGRAVMIPALDGTLERKTGPPLGALTPYQRRDRLLHWVKDFRRSIDYLETRPDIDASKVAFYGLSAGAMYSPLLVATEPRVKTAVLVSGGSMWPPVPPEADSWNYAPRVKVPVLMLNGRDDFTFPAQTRQLPLFRAFATPAADKQYVQYEGGHVNLMTRLDLVRTFLDWLDRYLGPPLTSN